MWIAGIAVIVFVCFLLYIGKTSYKDRPAFFRLFVNSYAKIDKKAGHQDYYAVFTGSSVMKFWASLEEDFLPLKVINRAIPGIKINELGFYIDQLVNKYKPHKVFIYAGSNDIQGSKARSTNDVLDGFKKIVRNIHEQLETADIYYISIILSPAKTRIRNRNEIEKANMAIQEYCGTESYLHYVDLTKKFMKDTGEPDDTLFRSDKIHITQASYEIWRQEISKYL